MQIIQIQPHENRLADTLFEHVDYRDAYEVQHSGFQNVDAFATAYFLSQSAWLRAISQNSFSKESIQKDIDSSAYAIGGKIGSWQIISRDEKEIVFGESMGFMDYLFSMHHNEQNRSVEVATLVKFNGLSGKFYFSLVKLLHKKFVHLSLHNTFKRS